MSAVPKPLQPWKARAFAGSAAFWFPGLLCLWGFPPAARGDDWPQFRGPRRDGAWAETGVLDSFPTGGPPARWRQEVGPGWASPVVSDGRVFVADASLMPTVPSSNTNFPTLMIGERFGEWVREGVI